MAEAVLTYADDDTLKASVGYDAASRFGNGTTVDGLLEHDDAVYVELGFSYPHVLEAEEESILSFLRLRNIAPLRFERVNDRLVSNELNREDFLTRVCETRDRMIEQAERRLIDIAAHKVVRVHPVDQGLTPIRSILEYLIDEGSLPASKVVPKHRRYLPFLEGLGYLERRGEVMHSGPELEKFRHAQANRDDFEHMNGILAEILKEGYRELVSVIGVNHITPIVRLAHAYYWTCAKAGRVLDFSTEAFKRTYATLHPGHSMPDIKLRDHLWSMAEAGLLEKTKGTYRAQDDVWGAYQSTAA